jgi:putative hydrolase of the HAD superfamily
VLFDLDGTLHDKVATLRVMADRQFDTAPLAAHAVDREAWRRAYVDLNETRLAKPEVFWQLGERFRLPAPLVRTLLHDFDGQLGAHAQPVEGALEFVRACKGAGLKTGLVTNGRDAFQRSKVAGLGLAPWLDAVVTSGGFGRKKPDPAIFQSCLLQLGVDATQAAFVGDDFEADMRPARALGMRTVWKSVRRSPDVDVSDLQLAVLQKHLLGPIER